MSGWTAATACCLLHVNAPSKWAGARQGTLEGRCPRWTGLSSKRRRRIIFSRRNASAPLILVSTDSVNTRLTPRCPSSHRLHSVALTTASGRWMRESEMRRIFRDNLRLRGKSVSDTSVSRAEWYSESNQIQVIASIFNSNVITDAWLHLSGTINPSTQSYIY